MAVLARIAVLAAAMAACAAGVRVTSDAHTSSASWKELAAKNRPVSKVITLLKDMLKQLEKEAEEDEEIYDKMACWCETNDKEKTKAVTDAQARITDLGSKIESLAAQTARLTAEIANLEKELAKNQESMDQATALRQKQLAEFNGEEKDLLESVSALKAAITVLSKHHADALVQADLNDKQMESIANTLAYQIKKHTQLLEGVLTFSQRRIVDAFVQAPEEYFEGSASFKQQYAPQSSQIFGILKQMKETFESNLAASQGDETSNQKAFEDLKSAKEAEIQAGQAQLNTKTEELASSEMKHAQASEDIEDTRNSLGADEQFLMMLKEKCSMTDKEWQERQKARQEEMSAVSKALAVLSGDDAHDLFTKTFSPALVQEASVVSSSRREEAAKLLALTARRLRSRPLAVIAGRVRLDAFERVKKAIDDMVLELQKQGQDEIKHRDFCVDELNTNQLQTEKKGRDKEDVSAQIADLESTITQLTQEIDGLSSEISEDQVQMKRAGEDRVKQNKEFQGTVADQRETVKLLQTALGVLNDFYNKGSQVGLVQKGKQEPAGPAPPPGFSGYKAQGASGGVIGLLQQIIGDAKAMEAEAIRAEDDAQKAYEGFVKDTNDSVVTKQKDIVNRSKAKATAEGDRVQKRTDKENVEIELEQLSNYNAELHSSCDFVMKNFDLRQEARSEEIEALKQAKAILSGANFEAFVQDK